MGHRTLILLINNEMHEWSRDVQLGQHIMVAASSIPDSDGKRQIGSNYGYVLECTHADTQRLAVIDSYHMDTLAIGHWSSDQQMQRLRDIALVKQAAEKLGYKLVKA